MTLELRPHHLLDIISDHGHGIRYQPHEYGHALHSVAEQVLGHLDQDVVFVIAADAICRPCQHLHADGQCDDVLRQLVEPVSKQSYNDDLDRRLWSYLGLDQGNRMTVRQFLLRVRQRVPGIETVCAHPGEERADRLAGLQQGLERLGIIPRIFHILRGDALEVRPSPFGSVGQIFRGQGIEVVWVKKQDEEIDPDWFSQPMVDLILVVQGKLWVEFERAELAPCVLEPGDLMVVSPDTRCRAYRWPRDAKEAAVFLAVYPVSGDGNRQVGEPEGRTGHARDE